MKLHFRFVNEDDMLTLYEWKNDPMTRGASFNREVVSLESHKKWFAASLVNVKRNMFMILDEGYNRIGQVRFDRNREDQFAEIDITVAPGARSKGLGTSILAESARFYLQNFDVVKIVAKIKSENHASLRAFEKAGYYVKSNERAEYITMNFTKKQI